MSAACRIVSQSDVLPMMTATNGGVSAAPAASPDSLFSELMPRTSFSLMATVG